MTGVVTFKFIWDKSPMIPLFEILCNIKGKHHPLMVYSCFNYEGKPIVDENVKDDDKKLRIYYAGERFIDDVRSHVTVGFLPNNAYLVPKTDGDRVGEDLTFVDGISDDKIQELTGLSKEELCTPFPIIMINIDNSTYPNQPVGVGGYKPDNKAKLFLQLREQERNQLEWWVRTHHLKPDLLADRSYLRQNACIYNELNTRWHAEGQRIRELGLDVAKPKFCCFIVTNPNCPQRNKFFDLLQMKLNDASKGRRVDSLGKYARNVADDIIVPDRMNQEEYFNLIRQYKYMITFENHALAHYHTEKIFNAFMAGTVPIYWGDPFINRVYDTRTFVSVPPVESITAQFRNYREGIEQIKRLENDPVQYLSMFDHDPVPNAEREDNRVHHNLFLLAHLGHIAEHIVDVTSASDLSSNNNSHTSTTNTNTTDSDCTSDSASANDGANDSANDSTNEVENTDSNKLKTWQKW